MAVESGSGLTVLADNQASLSELMAAISDLATQSSWARTESIGIASNVTLNLMDVFLRRHAYLHGVDIKVQYGAYDDYLGDVERFLNAGVENLLLLSFFDNLLPSFEAQIQHMPADLVLAKQDEVLARLELALDAGKAFKNIYLAKFHRYSSPKCGVAGDRIGHIISQFNDHLEVMAADRANVSLLDLNASIENIGYQKAFDDRFYTKSKAPYSTLALNEIVMDLSAATRGWSSYFYKAIVLDCDDTLWGGVIGEDLPDGIKLDPYDFPGNVFWRIQNELLALEKSGVLICLCSRNNPEDVEEVLEKHPHMLLRNEHIILKKTNWNDKVSNLREIAKELNIGLDSLVFIDDSDFECQSVKHQLPMVKTVQVPKLLSDYFRVFEGVERLFETSVSLPEGQSKTEQYRIRNAGIVEGSRFDTQQDYLHTLNLKVELSRDLEVSIPRISELTLKSNQFNLTTQRYSSGEIERMILSRDYSVYSFNVEDKFGSYGLTGVLITHHETGILRVDTFLMSCRVIGRGVEFSVWNHVFEDARAKGCTHVETMYIPTQKNAQVKDFYERLGLEIVFEEKNGMKHYRKELEQMKGIKKAWIKVIYA